MLARHTRFTTKDLDEATSYLSRLLKRRLEILEPGEFTLSIETTALDYITVTRMECSAPLLVHTGGVSGYTLVRMEDGTVERNVDNRQIVAGPGEGVLTTPGKTLITKTTAFTNTIISIPPAILEAEASLLIGDQVIGPLEITQAVPMRETRLGQRLDFLLTEISRNQAGLIWDERFSLLRVEYQRNMIATIITGTPNNYEDLLDMRYGGGPSRHVSRLKEFLYSRLRIPTLLGDMAQALSLNRRTLIDHCGRVPPGLSPVALLRDMRLEAAHEAFEYPQPEDTVASVALRYCFYNLGRFAKYYERRYGETPLVALQRGRRRNGAQG